MIINDKLMKSPFTVPESMLAPVLALRSEIPRISVRLRVVSSIGGVQKPEIHIYPDDREDIVGPDTIRVYLIDLLRLVTMWFTEKQHYRHVEDNQSGFILIFPNDTVWYRHNIPLKSDDKLALKSADLAYLDPITREYITRVSNVIYLGYQMITTC
jgi:hypothetical protein